MLPPPFVDIRGSTMNIMSIPFLCRWTACMPSRHREEPANVSRSDASVRSESANLRIVRMLISRWCWACRRRLCQRSWYTPRIGPLIQDRSASTTSLSRPAQALLALRPARLLARATAGVCPEASPRPVTRPCRSLATTSYRQLQWVGPPLTGDSYQRDLLKPPPPFATRPPPSPFGRASLTLSVFPSRSLPLRASIAFWASASLVISTNPKPLGWPVSRSVTILTCPTVRCVSKSERTDCSGPKTEVPYKDVLHLFLPSGFDGRLIGAGGTKTIGRRSNTANSIAQCSMPSISFSGGAGAVGLWSKLNERSQFSITCFTSEAYGRFFCRLGRGRDCSGSVRAPHRPTEPVPNPDSVSPLEPHTRRPVTASTGLRSR